jgi:hypothetical protein
MREGAPTSREADQAETAEDQLPVETTGGQHRRDAASGEAKRDDKQRKQQRISQPARPDNAPSGQRNQNRSDHDSNELQHECRSLLKADAGWSV